MRNPVQTSCYSNRSFSQIFNDLRYSFFRLSGRLYNIFDKHIHLQKIGNDRFCHFAIRVRPSSIPSFSPSSIPSDLAFPLSASNSSSINSRNASHIFLSSLLNCCVFARTITSIIDWYSTFFSCFRYSSISLLVIWRSCKLLVRLRSYRFSDGSNWLVTKIWIGIWSPYT